MENLSLTCPIYMLAPPWVTGYMAARPDSLFAARYFRFVVCIRQYRRHG